MRAIERAAIDSGEVTGLELMERAGRGVVEAVFEEWPELAAPPGRAVVLCGPGNNGGDGFVVARLLKQQGWCVEVYLYGDAEKLPPDAAENYRRWCEMGEVYAWNDHELEDLLDTRQHSLVVDAVFGTGLKRLMPEDTSCVWRGFVPAVFTDQLQRYVAVDLPSGICSDSGANLEGAFPANLTVSFHAPKLGHYLYSRRSKTEGGVEWCGVTRVADIGLTTPKSVTPVELVDGKAIAHLSKGGKSHKFSHGHAFVLSGGVGKGGAARLAARGALRVGAGVVTVGAPPAAIIENACQLTAIMLSRVKGAEELAETLSDERINAVCLGPGLGVSEDTRAKVAVALNSERGVVLDADALSSFKDAPEALFAFTKGKKAVLTPHMGEFGRLFPDIKAKLDEPPVKGPAYSKVDAAREAAARAGCVVLMKGPDTVIASPDGRASIAAAVYERACPWLATAGAGDVLAGIITGLLARGFGAHEAAATGAWLHQEAARAFGPGLIAEDLPEMLPKVFRELGL
ncbi:MAG: NAD(P)H-hydrate dehydratase [Pikeienuella sp.]